MCAVDHAHGLLLVFHLLAADFALEELLNSEVEAHQRVGDCLPALAAHELFLPMLFLFLELTPHAVETVTLRAFLATVKQFLNREAVLASYCLAILFPFWDKERSFVFLELI